MLSTSRITLALMCAVLACLTVASSAQAAFPGKNGRIVFSSDRDSPYAPHFLGRELFSMRPDGTDLVQLTENTGFSRGDAEPTWSPDGKRIAFVRSDTSGTGSGRFVYVMNADGSGLAQVPNTGFNARGVSWSPDGQRLAFANVPGNQCGSAGTECTDNRGGHDIWTVGVDGSGLTRLTTMVRDDVDPAWSADGTQIAFVSNRNPNRRLVYKMNADGTGQVKLTSLAFDEGHPDWSPDGSRVVYHSDRQPHNGGSKIWTVSADGTDFVQVTNSFGSVDRVPVWSPDGTRLAFTSPMDVYGYRIFTSNPDGSGLVRITDEDTDGAPGAYDFDADWQPLPPPRRADYRNAAQFCKAEREYLGEAAFTQAYGGKNAHARCIKQNK